MAVFEARYLKFQGLAHGHDADIATVAVALHTDFNDAIEILLAHAISPVFVVPLPGHYAFPLNGIQALRNWFL
ncbi:hypothetical protein D3C86_2170340 [compost metagenome]